MAYWEFQWALPQHSALVLFWFHPEISGKVHELEAQFLKGDWQSGQSQGLGRMKTWVHTLALPPWALVILDRWPGCLKERTEATMYRWLQMHFMQWDWLGAKWERPTWGGWWVLVSGIGWIWVSFQVEYLTVKQALQPLCASFCSTRKWAQWCLSC
jgi:hypothetical protein